MPVNRQMMITLARPSMAESRPNPSRATDPAMTVAMMAMAPSAAIQASDSQDTSLAWRAARCQPGSWLTAWAVALPSAGASVAWL